MASTGEVWRLGRRPALDGVRGIAILLVVAGHLDHAVLRYGGLVGLILFFVLSGYLITGVLLAERDRGGRIRFAAFYWRRAVRLLPALLVVLAAVPVLLTMTGDPRLAGYPRDATVVLLYLSSIVCAAGGDVGGLLDHTWSLSVEELFYLAWPIMLVALLGVRRLRLSQLVVGLAAVSVVWRLLAATLFGFARVYYAPDTTAFALLIGCAVAALQHEGRLGRPRVRPAVGLAVLLALSFLPFGEYGGSMLTVITYGSVVVALAAAWVIWLADGAAGSLFAHPVARWFGQVSYGWYLWHQVLLRVQFHGAELTGTGRIVAVELALGLAWLSYRYLEAPVVEWGRRRLASGSDQAVELRGRASHEVVVG